MNTPREVILDEAGVNVLWDDGLRCRYPHRLLRAECRCAACVNEFSGQRMVGYDDVRDDVEALDWMEVGRYALRFLWSDMHDTGIYPFEVLREVCARHGLGQQT